jgi:hypothetical protein
MQNLQTDIQIKPQERSLNEVLAGLKVAMLDSKLQAGTCIDNGASESQKQDYQAEPQQYIQLDVNSVQMIETVSKPITQPTTQPTPNGSQTVPKPTPNGCQIMETVSETVAETVSKRPLNGFQTASAFDSFSTLSPAQRKLLKVLYNNARINGNRTTQKLGLSYIAEIAQTSARAAKSIIWKLKHKGFLTTKEYKDGRSGWVIYEIPEAVFFNIVAHDNGFQTVTETVSKPTTQPTPTPLYNNSNSINTIITTSNVSQVSTLPTEWQEIDITPLVSIGLSKKHIAALYEANNIAADAVQESINSYAWGLKNNPEPYKKYKNHLCGLMGVLKKGHAWIESGYESEIDLLAKEMATRQRQQKERREKQLNELVDLAFPDWESNLTDEQRKAIVPSGMKLDEQVCVMLLRSHFKKEVLLPSLGREAQLLDGVGKQ